MLTNGEKKNRRSYLFAYAALSLVLALSFGCTTVTELVSKSSSPGSSSESGQNSPANSPAELSAKNPSSLDAIRRGLASVTPPASPLKDIHFDFDSYDLRPDARETLSHHSDWMKANSAIRVEIEGHCDDLGTSEYNLALGAKRAQVARDYLVSLGIAAERLVTISYGKEAPACFESTEECRKMNRRARFVVFTELPTS